ncbi:MAG: DNA-3-methyladenine glycosylase [Rubripirellula sp.]
MTRAIHLRFIAIAEQVSPKLADSIQTVGPVKLSRRDNQPIAELLCRVIAGQQLSVKAASTIWGRVTDGAGNSPLIDHIDVSSVEQLRGCGLSNNKAKAMKAIVEANSQGILNTDTLRSMDPEVRSKTLTGIWGVGQWTADMISISYFGDPNVWPDTDVTVWKTLEKLTSRRRKTALTAARFAPHRTYLALYMWKIADASPSE